MAVIIKKLGGDIQINVDTTLFYIESPTAPRKVTFDNRVSPPKIEIKIGSFDSGSILLSTLKLGDAEAIPANLADFQTKWGALFPNPADVASGSTTVTTDTTISGDGSSGSPLSVVSTLEATRIHAATSKATPVDADEIALIDSAASNVLKKLTWANLKATLWSSWGALIGTGTSKSTLVDADAISIMDSEASNATKKLTWANLKATAKTYFDTLYNATNTNLVDKTVTNTYTAGAKQIFVANGTNSGIGFGGVTADPSTNAGGDLWFRSELFKWSYYDGTTIRRLVTEQLAQTLLNKTIDAANNTISGLTNSNLSGSAAITNANLANSAITINGSSTALGGSIDSRSVSGSVSGSDFTTTSNAASTITGLSVAVGANKKYRITASITLTSPASINGMKFTITAPASTTLKNIVLTGPIASSIAPQLARITAFGTLTTVAFGTSSGTTSGLTITGYFDTAGTAGNVALQVASSTNTETSTIKVGSTMDVTEVQ